MTDNTFVVSCTFTLMPEDVDSGRYVVKAKNVRDAFAGLLQREIDKRIVAVKKERP